MPRFASPRALQQERGLPLALVWLCALLFIGYGLGNYALLDNNEGLYAEIAREMLHSGRWQEWVIPHLNGLVYMEKPPLLYWLTALAFALFGEHEWVARLVPALSAGSCVALLLWFGRRIGHVAGARLAALMFVSSLGVMAMARTLMFDLLLTALLTAALMSAYLFVSGAHKSDLRRSLAALAVALLAKGFVALVLYAAVLGAYLLWQARSPRAFLRSLAPWFDARAWALFFLIAAPWHVAASLVEPAFAWFYFINEHVLRFLGRREPHDYYSGPWWYYLPRMLVFLFPWCFVLLAGRTSPVALAPALRSFLTLAWLMPAAFFSLSSAKANYYLIAVMPLLSLQIALALDGNGGSWRSAMPGVLIAGLSAFAAQRVGLADLGWLGGMRMADLAAGDFLRIGLYAVAACALAAAALCRAAPRLGVAAYALPAAVCLWLFVQVAQVSESWTSSRAMAQYLRQQGGQPTVVMFHAFEKYSSLSFYLGHPIPVLESRSADLYWGNRLYRNDMLWTDEQFADTLAGRKIGLLVGRDDLADFYTKPYSAAFNPRRTIGALTLFEN